MHDIQEHSKTNHKEQIDDKHVPRIKGKSKANSYLVFGKKNQYFFLHQTEILIITLTYKVIDSDCNVVVLGNPVGDQSL